jgi:hypothetical protein
MYDAGFDALRLAAYTGFKSSAYTEGALVYGERPAAGTATRRLPEILARPTGAAAPATGGA